MGELFTVEYNKNIDNVPESILIIPLVSNILPILWVNNATLYVNQIDNTFYKSIKKIKKAYKEMLPQLKFKGKIKYNKKVTNNNNNLNKTLTFFSGGVDSYYTLIKKLDEKPDLATIWGADIDYENKEGWLVVKKYVENIGKKYKLNNVEIHSALRRFIDNSELEKQYHSILDDNWWYAMQHGIGLIGNIAPYAYKYNINIIYIPSTYSKGSKILCASRPEIDNNFKFANTKVYHEGNESNRQQKVEMICNYIKKTNDKIKLRVCYRSLKGDNCNNCEKCYRTIMAIISQKIDPNDLGFKVDTKLLQKIENEVLNSNLIKNRVANDMWKDIIKAFNKDKDFWKNYDEIKWIFKVKI